MKNLTTKLPCGTPALYHVNREKHEGLYLTPPEFETLDNDHAWQRELLDAFISGTDLPNEYEKRRVEMLSSRKKSNRNMQPDQYIKKHVNDILNNDTTYKTLNMYAQGFGRRGQASTALYPAILGVLTEAPWSKDLLMSQLVEHGVVTPNVTIEENVASITDLIKHQPGWKSEEKVNRKIKTMSMWECMLFINAALIAVAGFSPILSLYFAPIVHVIGFYLIKINTISAIEVVKKDAEMEVVADEILKHLVIDLRILHTQGVYERKFQSGVIADVMGGESI